MHDQRAYLEIPTDELAAKQVIFPIVTWEVDAFDPRGLGRSRRWQAGSAFFQWKEMPAFPNHVVLFEGVQRSRIGWAVTKRDFGRLRDVYLPSPVRSPLRNETIRLAYANPHLRPHLLKLLLG